MILHNTVEEKILQLKASPFTAGRRSEILQDCPESQSRELLKLKYQNQKIKASGDCSS